MLIAQNFHKIEAEISLACQKHNRPRSSVKLIGASKAQPAATIEQAYCLGLKSFGENYFQEASEKQNALKELEIDWHFIGKLQSNKAKLVTGNFSLIHSVDKVELAKKINDCAAKISLTQKILIEVNIDNETSKGGIIIDEIFTFAENIAALKNIKVLGLMSMPAPSNTKVQASYARTRELLEAINSKNIFSQSLTELSMGMSGDFSLAIAEGATMIRIGTRLFGERNAS